MLTADQIRDLLRCLPDGLAMEILALMRGEDGRDMVYEAERLAMGALGAEGGHELIASLARGARVPS
jgi:hypothetical protein